MTGHLISVDKNTYESLQKELIGLRQSEARFQRLADNLPGMLYEFRLDSNGVMSFSYASSGCRDIFGVEPEQIQNDLSLAFICANPNDIPGLQSAFIRSAQTLQNFEYEWRIITPDGKEKWVKAIARPERQLAGDTCWYGYLVDTSEQQAILRDRQQAELKLQEQAQFLQSIWEGVDYGIYVLDVLDDGAEFRYARFNPAIIRISPIPLESFVGKTTAQALPANAAHLYRQHYQECIKLGKSVSVEESFHVDDKETWWLLNITPLFNSILQVSQVVVTVTEITERKQTEQERQMFVSLIENSSDFIGFATLQGKPLFLNESGLKLIGVDSLDVLKEHNIIDCMMPEDREDMQQRIISAVMEHGLWQGEYRFRHFQTNEAIPVDFNIFLIKSSETGEPLCLATITRDICDVYDELRLRKQAEEALKASQHFIQRIADSSPNILYIFDLKEQRNIYANQEIANFIGYSTEEMQQMGNNLIPNVVHPEDIETILYQHQKLLTAQDGDIFEMEFRMKGVNGEWYWFYSRETPFSRDADGKVRQILGVSSDITERKQSEIKLQQQAENLENTLRELQHTQGQLIHSEKMSSLGNMVAGVAHEINNPVNFIHGNLIPASEYTQDLLELVQLYQEFYPYPPEEIQAKIAAIDLDFLKEDLIKLLKSMRIGTQRIREIVLSLRNFSRLDESEFKEVDIHEGIDSTLMILQNRLKAKPNHLEILVKKEYGKLPAIACYPGQLNQVFMNLISNAIDALEESFIGEQGQICISTEVINSNRVAIRISDNGMGIYPEILAKLFDPFFTTKGVGKGTGLGLSISYQIVVDKHSGKLSCHSIPGQGAEFIIEIPISQKSIRQI